MAVNLKNVTSKLFTKHASHVGKWSRRHASYMRGGTLAREHISTQGTLTRKDVSTPGTSARKHVFSTQDMQFSRLYKAKATSERRANQKN